MPRVKKNNFFVFLKSIVGLLFLPILFMITTFMLTKKLKKCKNLIDYIEIASSFNIGFRKLTLFDIKLGQVKWEIYRLLKFLMKFQPHVILEIGTWRGGTLFLFTKIASSNASIISIDLPQEFFKKGYCKWRVPVYKSFAEKKQKVYPIRANSHWLSTLEKIKKILGNEKIDFLFIDGDHSYQGVKKDFEMYGQLVKKGGIIAFHDIVPSSKEIEVPKFWKKIKKRYKHIEIVKSWKQGTTGIGIIFKH